MSEGLVHSDGRMICVHDSFAIKTLHPTLMSVEDDITIGRSDLPLGQNRMAWGQDYNSTQNKFQTHRAKQYEVTLFLSTDCELSTETCSKNVYSLGPLCMVMF